MRAREALVLLGLLVAGCTITREPHLYPDNDIASQTGVLTGQFVGHGQLHGTADVTMPDGEVLHGEYSIVADGSVSFGSIFGSVYGPKGAGFGTASTSGVTIAGSGTGQASMLGSHGTSAQCEFLNDNMTGHGYGACRLSNGGLYRLQY